MKRNFKLFILTILICLLTCAFGCVHEHTFSEEWKYDNNYHWHDATCEHDAHSDKLNHNYQKTVIDATYESEGSTTYTCKTCSYSTSTPIAQKEHRYASVLSFSEQSHWYACIDQGYEALKKGEAEHEWETTTTQPTFESNGSVIKTCKQCGYEKIETVLDKLEHNYSNEWTQTEDMHWHACTDEGYEDLKKDEGVHYYSEKNKVVVDSDYENEGSITYTCDTCNKQKIQVIPKKEHKYSTVWTQTSEKHYLECVDAGYESLKKNEGAHVYDESKKTVIEATYESAGSTTYKCTVCSYENVIPIPQKVHEYSDEWTQGELTHWHACTDKGYESLKADEAPHDKANTQIIKKSSLTEYGEFSHTCSVCAKVYTEVMTEKLELTLPVVINGVFVGQTLSATVLSGGESNVDGRFEWKNSAERVGASGAKTAVFIPTDIQRFEIVEFEVEVTAVQLTVTVNSVQNGSVKVAGEVVSGAVFVDYGSSLTLTFVADRGYYVSVIYVDGQPVSPAEEYSLTGITKNISVSAEFAESELSTDEKEEVSITNVSDISKVYDGTSVEEPTFETNSTATPTFTYYVEGSEIAISAPVNAGSYSVKISLPETATHKSCSKTVDFTISKQSTTVISRPFIVGSIAVGQLLSTVELSGGLSSVDGTFAWAQPTEKITESGSYLVIFTPADSINYEACTVVVSVKAKTELFILSIAEISKTYNGVAVSNPSFTTNVTYTGAVVTYTYRKKGSQEEIPAPKDVGEYLVTVSVSESETTLPAQKTAEFIIIATTPTIISAPIVPKGVERGQMLSSVELVGGQSSVAGTFAWAYPETVVSTSGAFLVVFTPTDRNYLPVNTNVQVTVKKALTILTVEDISKTYDGLSVDNPEFTTDIETTATAVFTYYVYGSSEEISAPDSAGNYTVKITIPDTEYVIGDTKSIDFSIVKATPVITTAPYFKDIASGQTLSTLTLTGGAANVEGKFEWSSPTTVITEESNHLIKFTPTDVDNYNIISVSVTVKISALPFVITCLSGSADCYTIADNTITFTSLTASSIYSISGTLEGNIVIDVGSDYNFELELHGFTLTSYTQSPLVILSGNKVSIVAKKDYENFIYDKREAIAADDTVSYSAAVYAETDIEVCGKGTLSIVSDNNNGIHTKDDLDVKNITLSVTCKDNALKGNDSVTIESGAITLIASMGDGIKTTNSGISAKGNQKGTVSVLGGTTTIYSACDGIDSAYNVVISGAATVLNIYTDKYSEYSEEVTDVADGEYYIKASSQNYSYSIKYYNSETDYVWENATYYTSTKSGKTTYYYYKATKKSAYSQLIVYMYDSSQTQGQDSSYLACSSNQSLNDAYDTIQVSYKNNSLSTSWTNYTTTSTKPGGGMGGAPGGGMQEGNTDKGSYSTKAIKAANIITIASGTVYIEAYDDAIHAGSDVTLENGETPLGNVTIAGGTVTLSSSDDGIHADGALLISAGQVTVVTAYEGIEGTTVTISGGTVSVTTKDDGLNATQTTGSSINLIGGYLYVYAAGDGIDSNSTTSYGAITFGGCDVVVFCTSGGNSAIDSDGGYAYTAGRVIAIMTSGGMTSESTHCSNFSSVGKSTSLSVSANSYVSVSVSSATACEVKVPTSMNAFVVYLGSSSASISANSSTLASLDSNGVYWASAQ